jgi:hypothetical protein
LKLAFTVPEVNNLERKVDPPQNEIVNAADRRTGELKILRDIGFELGNTF